MKLNLDNTEQDTYRTQRSRLQRAREKPQGPRSPRRPLPRLGRVRGFVVEESQCFPWGSWGVGREPNATRKHQKFPSSDFQVLHAFSSLEKQTIEEVKEELNDRQVLPGRNPRGKRRRSGGGAWEQQQVHEAPLRAREAPGTRRPRRPEV